MGGTNEACWLLQPAHGKASDLPVLLRFVYSCLHLNISWSDESFLHLRQKHFFFFFCFFKPCGSASSLCDHSAVFMLAPSCVERTLTDRKVSECDSTFSGSFCFERTTTTAFAPVVPDVDSACRTAALEGFAVRRLSILTPATLTWAWSDLDSLNS